MAQAPQGPTGAPRQNKTVKEFKGMNTQNRRNAIPEGSFAWLENIQPIGPGHLHSIPGRSTAVVRIPPEEPPPPGCTDATERGQQIVSIEDRFVQEGTYTCTFGGLRTSWGYISPMEEVYTLIGCAGCGGGNMDYDVCTQINHFQNPSVLVNPPLINPLPALPSTMRMGTSDEPIYMPSNTAYYPNSNTSVDYVIPAGLTLDGSQVIFAKKDTSIYLTARDQVFPNFFQHILEYNAATGALLNDFDLGESFLNKQMALSSTYIYILVQPDSGGEYEIRRYLRSDGSFADTFFIDDLQPNSIGLVNDNLIYILGAGDRATLYYIKNFTDLVYVGYTGGAGFSPFYPSSGLFLNGAFYYGSSGTAGFSTDIFKVSIACPEGSPSTPLIASLDRSSASVAAGATITVSWADILVATTSDQILLYPEPAAGKLGFEIGGQLASQAATGNGTDSLIFTIPLATPPGNYLFFYSGPGFDIYIAKSPVFAVT